MAKGPTSEKEKVNPEQSSFDYIGLFAGLAAGELANILQGYISYYGGVPREMLSWTFLAVYIAFIVNYVSGRKRVSAAEKTK